MTTKQDFVDFIKTIPGAAEALGDDLTKWADGQILGVEDKWFGLFQTEGGDQHVANIICCFLNIPSVGYDDFSNAKQRMADAYKGYVAAAQQEVDAQQAIVDDLNAQLVGASGDQETILRTEASSETSRLSNAKSNLSVWENTLKNYMDANPGLQ
jgi:hypothetical protein